MPLKKPFEAEMPMKIKRLVGVEEAALYLSISPRTIYNGIGRNSKNPFPVKPKRYGKRVLFDIRDLDKFVDSLGGPDGSD